MEIQHGLGADLIMAFDECTPYPSTLQYAQQSMEMTCRWAERCLASHQHLAQARTHRPLRPSSASSRAVCTPTCGADAPGPWPAWTCPGTPSAAWPWRAAGADVRHD